jgi:tripartite-type tricarboxylate transporter receptor subunit TctC
VVARLNQEIANGYRAPDIRERLEREGNEVVVASPGEFAAFFRSEMSKWARVIRDAGIKLE